MDPYLYTAGMRGESFKIDDISDIDGYARKAEENKLALSKPKAKTLNWIAQFRVMLSCSQRKEKT